MATVEQNRQNSVMHEHTDHPPFGTETPTPRQKANAEPRAPQASPVEVTASVVTGGSTVEAIGGAAAVVLAILGLAGVLPIYTVTVAGLAVGFGLLMEGGALASRHNQLLAQVSGGRLASTEFGGGMSAEIIGGIGGGVLALLALLGVAPLPLTAIAAIVFGGTLLFGAGATARLRNLSIRGSGASEFAQRVAAESVSAASGAQIFVGVGAVALGILALVGLAPLTLNLVAMLAIGGSILLSGIAIGSRMETLLGH